MANPIAAAKGVVEKVKDEARKIEGEVEGVVKKVEDAAKGLVDKVEGEFVKLVKMFRDPELYAAPHTADVHPAEVANYQKGGWMTEDQVRAQAEAAAAAAAPAPDTAQK